MDRKVFGDKVRQARNAHKMTSESLAGICDVNPVFIRQIESGARMPSLPVFVKICSALGTSPEYFLMEQIKHKGDQENKDEISEMLSGITGAKLNIVKGTVKTLIDELNKEM